MACLEVRTQKIGCVNHDCDECKAKAQRTWVGLTDYQRKMIVKKYSHAAYFNVLEVIDEIEAKLKEKNT